MFTSIPIFRIVILAPIIFFFGLYIELLSKDRISTKGFREGETLTIKGCRFRFVKPSVVESGEGMGIFYRIYPRRGEDYFFTIRELPKQVTPTKNLKWEDEEFNVEGNLIVVRTRYIPEGNLILYQAVRKEYSELFEFFLSCDPIEKPW